MFVRTEEVIISNPEGKVIVGTVDVVKAVCVAVRSLIGVVKPFDHLFEWAVLRRNSIVVGKSNAPGDLEGKVFPELLRKFHRGERIGTVAGNDELKFLRQLCKPLESHMHGKDAGADTTIIGYLIAGNGTGCGIHDRSDICFETTDFYVGFIGSKEISFFVRILVNKVLNGIFLLPATMQSRQIKISRNRKYIQ